MKKMKKILLPAVLLLALALTLTACNGETSSSGENTTTGTNAQTFETATVITSPVEVDYSKYDLDDSETVEDLTTVSFAGEDTVISGSGCTYAENKLTITAAGTYSLSGHLQGQILVAVEETEKVRLILAGVTIENNTDACILAQTGDKLIITLAADTVNTVTDSDSTVASDTDTRSPAAIYSCISLTVNGTGELHVSSTYKNAIATKKKLKVVDGVLRLTAANVGLKGNNGVSIDGGDVSITSGGSGIKTEEIEDTTKGYVVISGGKISITAGKHGIDASLTFSMTGGDVTIVTTGTERQVADTTSGTTGSTGGFWGGGRPGGSAGGSSTSSDGYEINSDGYYKIKSKGVKAGSALAISGGTLSITSTGTAIQSDGTIAISGDPVITAYAYCSTYKANSKGISADGAVTIAGGTLQLNYTYEGIESKTVLTIDGGNIHLNAVDDGLNASSNIVINGGYLYIDAQGDGIDSNGNIIINGGMVLVAGPTNSGNGAFDCGDGNYSIAVNGGTVLAYGASGMAEYPGNSSTQYSIGVTVSVSKGTLVSVLDESGNLLFAFTATQTGQSVCVSVPAFAKGQKVTVCTGGSISDAGGEGVADGVYTSGTVTGGTTAATLTLSSVTTTSGSSSGGIWGRP